MSTFGVWVAARYPLGMELTNVSGICAEGDSGTVSSVPSPSRLQVSLSVCSSSLHRLSSDLIAVIFDKLPDFRPDIELLNIGHFRHSLSTNRRSHN